MIGINRRGVVAIGRIRAGVNWNNYWATLISATVENAAPTNVVLTFPAAQASLGTDDFTIAGFTISSASWTGAVLTLVLSETVLIFDGNLSITFGKTSGTAIVTNNVADDGNTVVWYDYSDASTLTDDGAGLISKWVDKINGHELTAATTKRPTLTETGILFDGVGNSMVTGAINALAQPTQIYAILRQITYTAGDNIFDGRAQNGGKLQQNFATPGLRLYAGASMSGNNNLTLNTFAVVRVLFSGANSKLQINETAALTGNAGTSGMLGLTLAAFGLGVSDYGHVEFKEFIARKGADDATTEALIYNYLKKKIDLVYDINSITDNAFFLPRIDDDYALSYVQALEPIFASYGFTGVWYINQTDWSDENNEALRQIVRNGIFEIAIHSYSHSDLTCSGKIFDVVKEAETITIDRTADTITLSGGGTISGFKAKTLAAIKTELEGLGVTVTPSSIYNGNVNFLRTSALGEIIDNGASVNEINILVDTSCEGGLYKAEMVDPKNWMTNLINAEGDVIDGQTGEVYVCRTFGYPYDHLSDTSISASINAGFIAARGVAIIGDLRSVNMFKTHDMMCNLSMLGNNETETRAKVRSYCELAIINHQYVGILAHNTTEVTIEEWGWILSEINSFSQIKVKSTQLFHSEIKNGVWTDDGDGTFSRTY